MEETHDTHCNERSHPGASVATVNIISLRVIDVNQYSREVWECEQRDWKRGLARERDGSKDRDKYVAEHGVCIYLVIPALLVDKYPIERNAHVAHLTKSIAFILYLEISTDKECDTRAILVLVFHEHHRCRVGRRYVDSSVLVRVRSCREGEPSM